MKMKEEKCSKAIKTVMAVIGMIVVAVAIAFAVYKFITRCKPQEECCDCEDAFEDEEACIELEFACPTEDEAVPAEAEEESAIEE